MTPNHNSMLCRLPTWHKLLNHKYNWNSRVTDLFDADPTRFDSFGRKVKSLYFDFSKNLIDYDTMDLLMTLAEEAGVKQYINDLLDGNMVNHTEKSPALHTFARATSPIPIFAESRNHMKLITNDILDGKWLGAQGDPIKYIVNIGVGGSDIGTDFVIDALTQYKLNSLTIYHCANIDPVVLDDILKVVDPKKTIFIVASKSFKSYESIHNATLAKQWLINNGIIDTKQHLIAITENVDLAKQFGIYENYILAMPKYIGGRFSLWSSIGLPIALSIGWDNYIQLLEGAESMDIHFRDAPLVDNIPLIAALISFWYTQCWGAQSHSLLPYAHYLRKMPNWLQQLDMESLGKRCSRNGVPLDYTTGQIVWGNEECNSQHSFHQMLHQGNHIIPIDFIIPANSDRRMLAECFAQSQTLMTGKSLVDAQNDGRDINPEHLVMVGNKPSNTFIIDKIDPYNIGVLLATYEHKVYCQAILLDINPFDQWGVEMGKHIGQIIYDDRRNCIHSATQSLLSLI